MKNIKELNVVYEDNHIIVVEKFTNTPSQGDKSGDNDMLTIVKNYIKEKYAKPRKRLFRASS
jgi:23S rRNA pseudouridine1911/1915/1917 synthase